MLAELIRTRMQDLGIANQRRLAHDAGISTAQMSMMLNGQVFNLTTETAGKLARVLQVPAAQVFAAALADVQADDQAATRAAQEEVTVIGAVA